MTLEVLAQAGAGDVAQAGAALVRSALDAALQVRGQAHAALTGGRTGAALSRIVAASGLRGTEHLWWGDERWVPLDSADRNDAAGAELAAAGAAVHRAPSPASGLSLDAAATVWGDEIRTALPLKDGLPVFDVVVLGLGEDGHIASLFPGRPELLESQDVVVPVRESPKPPAERLSLGLRVLGAARCVVFVTAGTGKAWAVQTLRRGWETGNPEIPAGMVRGVERTVLIADRAALGRD
ncbi:MAG: 6-phosphogluconolactonase [Microbacteriaceae bacterium]|jgi:6-phosphogluconolactonase|nr:6-phosphogluconolactonase [Microbacteriaceae bacterium]